MFTQTDLRLVTLWATQAGNKYHINAVPLQKLKKNDSERSVLEGRQTTIRTSWTTPKPQQFIFYDRHTQKQYENICLSLQIQKPCKFLRYRDAKKTLQIHNPSRKDFKPYKFLFVSYVRQPDEFIGDWMVTLTSLQNSYGLCLDDSIPWTLSTPDLERSGSPDLFDWCSCSPWTV